MNYRIALVLSGSAAVHPLVGQAVTACSSQLIPLKPVSLISCSTAAPVCIADASGLNGHWIWGCPVPPPSTVQLDPTIPLRVAPPHIISPIETATEVEQLRQLRLQNQMIQQQIDMQRLQLAAEIPPEAPAVLTPLDRTNWNIMKGPLKSMYLWGTLKPNRYQRQVEKALDKFYTDASHLSVKIPDAVIAVSATIK